MTELQQMQVARGFYGEKIRNKGMCKEEEASNFLTDFESLLTLFMQRLEKESEDRAKVSSENSSFPVSSQLKAEVKLLAETR